MRREPGVMSETEDKMYRLVLASKLLSTDIESYAKVMSMLATKVMIEKPDMKREALKVLSDTTNRLLSFGDIIRDDTMAHTEKFIKGKVPDETILTPTSVDFEKLCDEMRSGAVKVLDEAYREVTEKTKGGADE